MLNRFAPPLRLACKQPRSNGVHIMKALLFPAFLIALVAAPTAGAGGIAMPPPGAARVANADAVLVGKVVSIEPQDVKVGNTNYRIAVVQIDDAIKGTKEGVKSL